MKKVHVEYLFLDLETCERCVGTDEILDQVMEKLTPALEIAGYQVDYRKIKMDTEELAREYRFLSSPTIRVNGADICETVSENNCGCCGEISGTEVDCRVFEYEGKTYEVPPAEMIAGEILGKIFRITEECCAGSCCGETDVYEIPENLKLFYEGKNGKENK